MSYMSTRGSEPITASKAILTGLAKDGGLFVPMDFPSFTLEQLSNLTNSSYQDLATEIFSLYLNDYSKEEISLAVAKAYDSKHFDTVDITPMHKLTNDMHVLELFHGPTLAFKDIALSILPYLSVMAAKKNNEKRSVGILVATSGDTGKAALEGFKDVEGTSCTVFYPYGGVSTIQERQMNTTTGNNTHVIGLKGNFDQAQTGVKTLFESEEFHSKLNDLNILPSSANSINFGRLMPQIVYYFYSYFSLIKSKQIKMGDKINFVVPTGNFGNILAGYYAKKMGLPIKKLICASNQNNVLSDFFKDGLYNTERQFYQTMSPSMDILISSNLERLLFEISGRDTSLISSWMKSLKEKGTFNIGKDNLDIISKDFWAASCDDKTTGKQIKQTYCETGYVLDPHTAVGANVLEQYRNNEKDQTVAVLLSTASPYKFPEDVVNSIIDNFDDTKKESMDFVRKLSEISKTSIPLSVEQLFNMPILHTTVCEKEEMENTVLKLLSK